MRHFFSRTIVLLPIGGGAFVFVLWLLLAGAGEEGSDTSIEPTPGGFEIGGQFPGGCLPLTLPTQEEGATDYPDQKISGALDEYFYPVERHAGREVAEVENEAFCLVKLDAKVFGFLNPNYAGPNGESATRVLELWSQSRQVPWEDICQVIWFDGNDPCRPEGPDDQEEWEDKCPYV